MKVDPQGSENQSRTGAGDGLRDAARGTRLQRVLADAGVGSRRSCEEMILAGRVVVNGTVVRELPAWVDTGRDQIRVDGRAIEKPEPHLYLMFNKPARTLATPREGPDDARRSVVDMVNHPLSARLFPAGRLDFEATGLLLLTNDGGLANRLTHARYGVEKTYQLVVRGTLDDASLDRINKVVGQVTKRAAKEAGAPRPATADLSILARESGRTVLELTSRDGRATLVRDTLAALGHPVKKMERVAIGPVRLRAVAVGQWRELERDELSALRRAASGKAPASEAPARGGTRAPEATGVVGGDAAAAPSQTAAPKPRRPRRLLAAIGPGRPVIAKRFRGIGRPVEDEKGKAPRRGGPRVSRRADSNAPPARSPVGDRRRGRGDGINAYRKKGSVTKGGPKPRGGRASDSDERPSETTPRRRARADGAGPNMSGPSNAGVERPAMGRPSRARPAMDTQATRKPVRSKPPSQGPGADRPSRDDRASRADTRPGRSRPRGAPGSDDRRPGTRRSGGHSR